MKKRKIKFFFVFFFIISFISFFLIFQNKEKKIEEVEVIDQDDASYTSNIMQDVKYSSKDEKGNEYIIYATRGEIDYSNNHIIYLTNVKAEIYIQEAENIIISSKFGKYNTKNFDTIFSKNVIINYADNKITSDYLDFSIGRNSMIISKNVIYKNLKNILEADNIVVNLKTKDTKIYMYEIDKKINIKSR